MFVEGKISFVCDIVDFDVQLIAGEVLIGAGSERIGDLAKGSAGFVEVPVAEKIGAGDVVILLFFVFEPGGHPFQAQVVIDLLRKREPCHIRLILVFLLAVEGYVQAKIGRIIGGENRRRELAGLGDQGGSGFGRNCRGIQAG